MSQNAALVLVDHQVGLMTGVRDYSIGELTVKDSGFVGTKWIGRIASSTLGMT
jgi:hypothetical protein